MSTAEPIERPRTLEDLNTYLLSLVEREHDYNTSAEALRDAALATFNCMAGLLGNSGFQASVAALDFYGKAMHVDGPFGIAKAEEMLYPQYPKPHEKVAAWEAEWLPWVADQAREKLAEYPTVEYHDFTDDDGVTHSMPNVHPNVHAHWVALAAANPAKGAE